MLYLALVREPRPRSADVQCNMQTTCTLRKKFDCGLEHGNTCHGTGGPHLPVFKHGREVLGVLAREENRKERPSSHALRVATASILARTRIFFSPGISASAYWQSIGRDQNVYVQPCFSYHHNCVCVSVPQSMFALTSNYGKYM